MSVMDTMIGKWKMDHSATENFDAYAAAMKFPEELTQKIKNETNVEAEMTRDGDTFTVVNNFGGNKETLTFKLGEKFKSSGFGIETENTFQLEGDVLIGEHIFHGVSTTSRRYVKDGRLVIESKVNGTTMKSYMVRC